jgi:hypothetical protein
MAIRFALYAVVGVRLRVDVQPLVGTFVSF